MNLANLDDEQDAAEDDGQRIGDGERKAKAHEDVYKRQSLTCSSALMRVKSTPLPEPLA